MSSLRMFHPNDVDRERETQLHGGSKGQSKIEMSHLSYQESLHKSTKQNLGEKKMGQFIFKVTLDNPDKEGGQHIYPTNIVFA